jgi:hypothetical protein
MRSIRSARRSPALLTVPLLMLVAACSEITSLEQSNPRLHPGAGCLHPANAQLLVSGAIGDFECAFHRYVLAQGPAGR